MRLSERISAAARARAADDLRAGADCPGSDAAVFVCSQFRLLVSAAICRRCQADPDSRRRIFADYAANRVLRDGPCLYATGPVAHYDAVCCDGRGKTPVPVFDCARHGVVSEPDCLVCGDFRLAENGD